MKKYNFREIFFDKNRRKIIELLEEKSYKQNELQNKLGFGRGTIQHHLKVLKDFGIINIKRKEKVKGRPLIISLKKKSLKDLYLEEVNKSWAETKTNPFYKEVLKYIYEKNKKGEVATSKDLMMKFPKNPMEVANAQVFLDICYYVGYKITDQGINFLKKK